AAAGETTVLPAVFVDEHPSAVLVRGVSHAAAAADPFMVSGRRFVPAAAPHAKLAVFVTNARTNEVTVDPTPKVKFLGAAPSGTATALLMEIDDASLPAVDLTVHAKGATQTQKIALK